MGEKIAERILKQIPATEREANDVVLCLDLKTGKTLWKKEFEGQPRGARSSSTACISGGRVFAAGTTHAYCLDAKDGKEIWKTPIGKSIASSFIVEEGIAVVLADSLIAFDTETGKELWKQEQGTLETGASAWTQLVACNLET